MFRCFLAVTLSGLLLGCGGGGSSDGLSNSVTDQGSIDISRACPQDMVCNYFEAPKDYYNSSSETVKIHYAVHKATDLDNRIGILVFNFGGPGAESVHGTDWMIKSKLPAEIIEKFDIVGMDPRGSGQSVYAQELTDCSVAASKKQGNCDSVYESIAPYVGTNSVVKDLDKLRITLGEDKLNFFGYSYGTRIGSQYAKMFPENVRALVLDSPMAPDEANYFELLKGKIRGFDTVINYRLGFDYNLKNKFVNIYNESKYSGSYTGSDGVILTKNELENIFYATFSQEKMGNWSSIKTGLFELLNNDTARLLKSQQSNIKWYKKTNDSLRSNNLFQLVTCTDEAFPLSNTDIINKGGEYNEISLLFSDLAKGSSKMCGYWPIARDPIEPLGSMEDVLMGQQVLIIAGQYDTNTHYVWGVEMANSFGNLAAFITVENTVEHGFSYTGIDCVDNYTTQYLLEPTAFINRDFCSGTSLQRKATVNDKSQDHPVKRANPIIR